MPVLFFVSGYIRRRSRRRSRHGEVLRLSCRRKVFFSNTSRSAGSVIGEYASLCTDPIPCNLLINNTTYVRSSAATGNYLLEQQRRIDLW